MGNIEEMSSKQFNSTFLKMKKYLNDWHENHRKYIKKYVMVAFACIVVFSCCTVTINSKVKEKTLAKQEMELATIKEMYSNAQLSDLYKHCKEEGLKEGIYKDYYFVSYHNNLLKESSEFFNEIVNLIQTAELTEEEKLECLELSMTEIVSALKKIDKKIESCPMEIAESLCGIKDEYFTQLKSIGKLTETEVVLMLKGKDNKEIAATMSRIMYEKIVGFEGNDTRNVES